MTRWLRRIVGLSAFLLAMFALSPPATAAGPTCNGKFVNPITDVCWSCLFPLSVGALKIWPSGRPDPGVANEEGAAGKREIPDQQRDEREAVRP